MNRCNCWTIFSALGLIGLLSTVAIIGGAICMKDTCIISQDASELYMFSGITLLCVILIVGVLSAYKYQRSYTYQEL